MEAALRFGIFVGIFAAVAVLEFLLPRRPKDQPVAGRWAANLGLLLVDVAAQRSTVGAAAFAAALWAELQGVGLFHLLALPGWLAGLLGFVLLDLALWFQHLVTHKVPLLWRLHQVHHADLDVDLTTGIRFHPVEIVLSSLYKAALVALLGIGPWTVLLFEAVLNGAALFTHGNVALPEPLDTALRWLVCTPDMHRVHHSTERAETDSNYGFFLSVWDRLFRTMRQAPAKGQLGVELGLPPWRDPGRLGLGALLAMPFRRPAALPRARLAAQAAVVPVPSSSRPRSA
jgi:sterol desaturase/sphingolipid hydroxylase (fatty acid hydroxylase superfamily)